MEDGMRAWMVLALMALGCSGDTNTDTDTDTMDADADADADSDSDTDVDSFSAVYNDVLKPSCATAGCHAAGTSNGMELPDESGAYDNLVDAPSKASPSDTLVLPGDPDNSYLVRKLEGGAGILGTEMPPPFGGQDPADIELIRNWIAAGANP